MNTAKKPEFRISNHIFIEEKKTKRILSHEIFQSKKFSGFENPGKSYFET